MKTLKTIFSLFLVVIATVGFAQTKTEKLKVAGECGTCKRKIEKAAKDAGASYALWNKDSKVLTVKYTSTSTNLAKIEGSIAGAGYDTPDIKATEEAYKSLDDCCQYQRVSSTEKSCCNSEKCAATSCAKDGKCTKDSACCKDSGCDKKDCCKKA